MEPEVPRAAPALPSPSQAAVGYAAASPGEEPGQVSSLLTFTACPDSGGTSDKPLQQIYGDAD